MLGKTAKIVSILVALCMVTGVLAILVPQAIAETAPLPKNADPEKMDIGPMIRKQPVDSISLEKIMTGGPSFQRVFLDFYETGDKVDYFDFHGSGWLEFEKRGEGNHCEVWVATDTSFLEGDERNDGREVIKNSHVDYIIEQFDDVIFPTETKYYGLPDNHTGDNSVMEDLGLPFFQSEDGLKTMIMIFNIIDESYFDPDYPSYVVGYYSPTTELYYDRNVIHIDSFDWDNRTTEFVERPFVYEGTVAHEFAHLLHDDVDPYEDTWVNEGISMYSEFLCNYMEEFEMWKGLWRFLTTPDNGLIDWGEQGNINIIADYNSVFLFMIYMSDHFGGPSFISSLFNSTEHGMTSIDSTLKANGWDNWTFDDVFYNWRLANLIHDDQPGDGWYNYKSIDWDSPYAMDVWIPYYHPSWGGWWMSELWGTTWTYDGYDTGLTDPGSYGTDYVEIYDLFSQDPEGLKFYFDGWNEVPEGWEMAIASYSGNVVWSEDFNHGGLLPSGWTTYSEGPDYWSWKAKDEGAGDWSVWCSSDAAGSGTNITEWLYMSSASVDLSGLDTAYLSMYLEYATYDYDDYAKVLINTGSGWETAAAWYPEDSPVAGPVVINISPWAGASEAKLALLYHGTWDWWMLVDDMMISEDIPVPNYAWYSGTGDLKDFKLVGQVDLSDSINSTLEFDTSYVIEEYWDFGFVQVSNDSGETWTSLENEFTTDEHDANAHPAIIAELPGLTGSSGGWTSMSFDLSAFDGQAIWIMFRYMTDWGYTEAGWWIDNIKVNGVLVDDSDSVFGFSPDFPETEWMVTVYAPAYGNMPDLIFDLNFNDQMDTLRSIHSLATFYPYFILIVSPTRGMADYYIDMFNTGFELPI